MAATLLCPVARDGGAMLEGWMIMAFALYPVAAFLLNATPTPRTSTRSQPAPITVHRQPWRPTATGGSASHGEERADCNARLGNPRFQVPNEYLAGWALTQNDTACLQRFQDAGLTEPCSTSDASSCRSGNLKSASEESNKGFVLWGEATRALLDRVDTVHDLDQRRLAASRYWQRLQTDLPEARSAEAGSVDIDSTASSASDTLSLSWADVNALFESDDEFVRRESERYVEEAAEAITSSGGWNADSVSRQWVASYRLSVFETRRQAQRFFSWGIPDEGALDCILEPGRRVLEVGSGLGYWAYLLKLRCGDDSRVRCFDPFAPPQLKVPPPPSLRDSGSQTADSGSSGATILEPAREGNPPSSSQSQIERLTPEEAEEVDDWFGERRAPFTPAEPGSFERIAQEDPHDRFRTWSLLICWPSDGRWPAGCLEAFEGDDFFYVGEGEGGATRMPSRLLREQWDLERRVAIPNWPGFKDALWWYRRKGAAPLPPNR